MERVLFILFLPLGVINNNRSKNSGKHQKSHKLEEEIQDAGIMDGTFQQFDSLKNILRRLADMLIVFHNHHLNTTGPDPDALAESSSYRSYRNIIQFQINPERKGRLRDN